MTYQTNTDPADECECADGGEPVTKPETCPRCDRAECERLRRQAEYDDAYEGDSDEHHDDSLTAFLGANENCNTHAVDWRARAIEERAKREAAEVEIAALRAALEDYETDPAASTGKDDGR